MVPERVSELRYLNSYFNREGSQILVVYGEKNVGKTTLLYQFARGKESFFYRARSASEREQCSQWAKELREGHKNTAFGNGREPLYPSYAEIFRVILGEEEKPAEKGFSEGEAVQEEPFFGDADAGPAQKKLLIVDEFQYMVKAGDEFMKELAALIRGRDRKTPVMAILCSSSIGWVENSMVTRIGETASLLSGFLKVRELGVEAVRGFFPDFTRRQCVETYAILGGVPGYWRHFEKDLSVKENICKHILDRDSFLYGEGQRIVEEELRETGVYNTILASIAAGRRKLNDLYLHTEFSRAKISVYLKNLMELELVEKVFSYDSEGKANTQKGVYRISNQMVHFYFTYLYPNLSSLERMGAEEFFGEYIAPSFNLYVADYFSLYCKQHFERWNKQGKLPVKVERVGEWVGKFGTIDIVAQSEEGKTILGICNWEKPLMRYDDYEWFLFCAEKAKLTPDYIYLFSVHNFEERLKLEAKVKPNMKLVSMDEM